MKIEVVVCDRCGEEIGKIGDKISVVSVRLQRRDEVKARELCTTCGDKLNNFLRSPHSVPEDPIDDVLQRRLEEQLDEVRKTSSRALEHYAEGAPPDELVAALRDVSSGARRR